MSECAHCGINGTEGFECGVCNGWKCHDNCFCTKRGDYVFIIERFNGSISSIIDVLYTQKSAALRLAECAKVFPGTVQWVNFQIGPVIMQAEEGRFSAACYRVHEFKN